MLFQMGAADSHLLGSNFINVKGCSILVCLDFHQFMLSSKGFALNEVDDTLICALIESELIKLPTQELLTEMHNTFLEFTYQASH